MKSEYCSACEKFVPQKEPMFTRNRFVDQPLMECIYCELQFCWRDYLTHECSGHKSEAEVCMGCDHYIIKDQEEVCFIGGDPYCKKCFTERPWERRKVNDR